MSIIIIIIIIIIIALKTLAAATIGHRFPLHVSMSEETDDD